MVKEIDTSWFRWFPREMYLDFISSKIVLVSVLILIASASANTGGPDSFGYTYMDNSVSGGPTFDWIEISGDGTSVLPDSDDLLAQNIPIGFNFNYYGTDHNELTISNNGLLFSGVGSGQWWNEPIKQSSIHGFMAPFWDDIVTWNFSAPTANLDGMNPEAREKYEKFASSVPSSVLDVHQLNQEPPNGSIYYKTIGIEPNRKFVVEWKDNQHFYSSPKGITFEAILFEGSNNIQFQYLSTEFGIALWDFGASATVGIESPDGNDGLQYSFDEPVINPGLSILFKFPAENDLSISKVAQVNGISVQQINPGEIFNYNITVTNEDLVNDAPLVTVIDKLPYDAEYIKLEMYPATPLDYTINQTGDLIYVRFDQIPAGSTRYINITVKAPTQAPTTLYNIINLRYRNDQNLINNRMTLATYVPLMGYNQTEAAKSFEDLLHNQSQLLFQFEDLLHAIPNNESMNYTFLVSFEQLLRSQAALTSSFEDLLTNESSTGWDTEYTEENRTELLWSYEQMLYDEAFLFASFNVKINDSWVSLCEYTESGHTQNAQTELIASFEDLLKRQTRLYKSFDLLLKKIDITSHQEMIDFVEAYENLLRVEANLFMSFNELLDAKYKNQICP
jgi:hypothetical protein